MRYLAEGSPGLRDVAMVAASLAGDTVLMRDVEAARTEDERGRPLLQVAGPHERSEC